MKRYKVVRLSGYQRGDVRWIVRDTVTGAEVEQRRSREDAREVARELNEGCP